MMRWAIRFHKWVALVVGIQVLGWVLGGLVMTAIPIEKVHGDQHAATPVLAPVDLKRLVPLLSLPAFQVAKFRQPVFSQRRLALLSCASLLLLQKSRGVPLRFDELGL